MWPDGKLNLSSTGAPAVTAAASTLDPLSTPSTVSRASNRLASTPLGSARAAQAGSKLTRKLGTSSTRLRGARLGAGLTHVPSIPAIDASKAILANPMVPEDRRNCPNCGNPVGRSRNGQPGRTEGFCPKCRNPFSFSPKLQAGDLVGEAIHPRFGIPVYSLYGEHHAPTEGSLKGLDLLVVDIQDIGVRFYTYAATVALTLEVCGRTGTPVLILDRPNPIGGEIIEGPIRDPALHSAVTS